MMNVRVAQSIQKTGPAEDCWWKWIGSAPYTGRLLAIAVLMVLFFTMEWTILRTAVRDAAAAALSYQGYSPAAADAEGEILLIVRGHHYSVTPFCTGVDVLLLVGALSWSTRWSWWRNLMWLSGFTVVVFGVNLLRLILGLYLHIEGVSWLFAHKIPYLMLYAAALAFALRRCLIARDNSGRTPDTPHQPTGAAAARECSAG